MVIFITGGVKGGKSMFAQFSAKYLADTEKGRLVYIATMIPHDKEDEKRIKRHLNDRDGWGFETIEEGRFIKNIYSEIDKDDIVLLDSVTAVVQNNIFFPDRINSDFDSKAFAADIKILSKKVKHLLIVSDYIFSDASIFDDFTELFIEKLGEAHVGIAAFADIVLECSVSNIKIWKNEADFDIEPVKKLYYDTYEHLKYSDI